MFLIIEGLFILLLSMVLFMIYRDEHSTGKNILPCAIAEEYWSGRERRYYVRFKKSLKVSYIVEKKPHLKNNGMTIDVSAGGFKLLMSEKLSKGTILDIKVTIPGAKVEAELEGEVVWSEDAKPNEGSEQRMFYVGVKFCGIKDPEGRSFMDYIRSLAADFAV